MATAALFWCSIGALGLWPAGAAASSYYLWDGYGGTFHDAEKSLYPTIDSAMCWAAAASNALAWTGWGMPSGSSFADADGIFDQFRSHWTNAGGDALYAWQWWFSGTHASPTAPGYAAVDVSGGGAFWPGYALGDYYRRENTPSGTVSALSAFLRDGFAVVLTLQDYSSGRTHQITAWGFDYDDRGATGVYVTDSDDSWQNYTPPDLLRFYAVSSDASGYWFLSGYYGQDDWFILAAQGLARFPEPNMGGAPPVPVPPAAFLLGSGLGVLVLLARKGRGPQAGGPGNRGGIRASPSAKSGREPR